MIEQTIAAWHTYVESGEGLDELLADDVVFYSPVVYTPQRGREITSLYLRGAMQVLGAGDFSYVREVLSGDTAVLEFETTVEGKYVNGVDIIRTDGAGRILEFRVMLRPLQAVNAVHEHMGAMLAALKS